VDLDARTLFVRWTLVSVDNAFMAGFRPVPVGSNDRVTKYRHFSAVCSFGKCPRTLILDSSGRCSSEAGSARSAGWKGIFGPASWR
jgi:hypothetical protein